MRRQKEKKRKKEKEINECGVCGDSRREKKMKMAVPYSLSMFSYCFDDVVRYSRFAML